MKALSFLGPSTYQPTTYVHGDRSYETRFFAEALPHFFPELEQVLVFVTPTVQQHDNPARLQERMGPLLQFVPIPEGRSEDELWQIFDALTNAVGPGEEVLFDITNSFRSIPLLVFLAAAFLRTARQVNVRGVIYAAYDARDLDANLSPVFDLTPFVSLLDWLTATNEFIYTGDARYLAHLVKREGDNRRSAALKRAGRELEEFSLAMMLARPLEVMQRAGGLGVALDRAGQDLAQYARPFGLLADRIDSEYTARALPQPDDEANVAHSLRHQLALIRWYLDNNQVIQGMSLAREWLVTAVGWRLGRGFERDVRERDDLARGLEGIARLRSGRASEDAINEIAAQMAGWPEHSTLAALWDRLATVRNDLDHVGMSPSASKAAKLTHRAQHQIWPELHRLAETWQIATTEEVASAP